MFTAIDSQGNSILARDHTGDRQCYCPGCGEKVVFKQGMINQAHFAHKNQSLCQTFSEGETDAHIEGKLLIYEWLKKESIQVELEAYLPELNQRPDLLIQYKGKPIAIEYQCSPISKEKIRSRTEGYVHNRMKVIWILGEKLKIKKSLTTRQYDYLSLNKNGSYRVFQLNDKNREIEVITDIRSSPAGITYHKSSIHFSDSFSYLTEVINRKNQSDLPVVKNRIEEEKHLAMLSFYKDSGARPFFELLYFSGMQLKTLPDVLFYSLSKEWTIKTLSYHWKLLTILWIEDLNSYQVITPSFLSRKICEWKKDEEISFHSLPGKGYSFLTLPFFEFFDLLSEKGYLTKVGAFKWIRKTRIF